MEQKEVLAYRDTDKCRVIVKEPLKEPVIKLIGIDNEDTQKEVGGNFECIPLGQTYMDIYINENGKYEDLMPNLKRLHQGKIYDIVVGTILINKIDDEGIAVGLTPDECFQAIMELNKIAIHTEREALHFKRQLEKLD